MKFNLFLFLYFVGGNLIAQNTIPSYSYFSAEKKGFIVKNNGDTLRGEVRILEQYPSVYFIPYKNNDVAVILNDTLKHIKVKLTDIKFIKHGETSYKVFNLKEFPNGSYIAKLIDSFRIVNIYYGYEFILNKEIIFGGSFLTTTPGFNIKDVYLIQIGNLTPEVFYNNFYLDYPFTVRDVNFEKFEPNSVEVNFGVNYKKQLKNIFYYKKDVNKYIKSLKDISFHSLPEIVEEINKMYK